MGILDLPVSVGLEMAPYVKAYQSNIDAENEKRARNIAYIGGAGAIIGLIGGISHAARGNKSKAFYGIFWFLVAGGLATVGASIIIKKQ